MTTVLFHTREYLDYAFLAFSLSTLLFLIIAFIIRYPQEKQKRYLEVSNSIAAIIGMVHVLDITGGLILHYFIQPDPVLAIFISAGASLLALHHRLRSHWLTAIIMVIAFNLSCYTSILAVLLSPLFMPVKDYLPQYWVTPGPFIWTVWIFAIPAALLYSLLVAVVWKCSSWRAKRVS